MKNYFSVLPLRIKLMLIGVIPIIFIIYLGFQYYTEKQQRLNALSGVIERIQLNGEILNLINEMQNERKLSFDFIMKGANKELLARQRIKTDSALKILQQSKDVSLTQFADFTNLHNLVLVRQKTDSTKSRQDVVTDFYTIAIFRLNTLTGITVTRSSRLQPVYDDLKAHKLLSEIITYLNIIQTNVYNVLYTKQHVNEILLSTYGVYQIYSSYKKEFNLKSSPQAINNFKELNRHAEFKQFTEYIQHLFETLKLDNTYTADKWWLVSEKGLEVLNNMQEKLWNKVITDTNNIYETHNNNKNASLTIIIIVLFIIIAIVLYTIASISSMLSDLKKQAEKIAGGQSNIHFQQFSKDEIGDLATAIQKIDENQRLLAQAADQIGRGNFKTIVNPRSEEDILGNAIVNMQEDLQSFSEKMEALVRQRTEQLENSNADLQQFAHVASHDLKEPLRKIQYYNSRINDEYANSLSEKGKAYLQKINDAAVRLSKLVDGILKYSVVNAAEEDFEKVDLMPVLENIVTDLELLIHQKNAVVTCNCSAVVYGIPLLMQQLFYNLLYNALKFSAKDVIPHIIIDCRKIKRSSIAELQKENLTESLYEIAVSDNGIGFSKNNSKKIFEVFGRLHSRMQYEGTGLGLALCKKIVTLHHGFIMAESTEGAGATFKIYLPCSVY